jgi:hypothetical protein
MKPKTSLVATLCILLSLVATSGFSQNVTVVAPTSAAAEGLNLQAVAELFKDAKDLESFEKELNDPDIGVNNLDLDNDGEVDFIRVVEERSDDAHLIILQVPLGDNDFQDIATIEVEKNGDQDYSMQICGNRMIYGPDYYIAPVRIRVYTWPIIPWIFRPVYHPYRSPFYFGYYPHWWHPWHPLATHRYRHHTVRYRTDRTFVVSHTTRVTRVAKMNYHPSSSSRVKKQTHIIHENGDRKPSVHSDRAKEHDSHLDRQRTGRTEKGTRRDHQSGQESTGRGNRKATESGHGKQATAKEREIPRRDRAKN